MFSDLVFILSSDSDNMIVLMLNDSVAIKCMTEPVVFTYRALPSELYIIFNIDL